ncbi:type II toxin-antitoxin system VapC family toxin [Thermococcus sp. MV11]|uniref:type II toxin-antitoxin system VapC family toxin n=1 Tax=Thermococcus sp. MV11 TaxID=1638267 RepID=UPI00142FDDC5|nr:type II toxin-antitoxin system VapC family toxin [Thermococcus sp. MV11]NJE03018.1 PIN domain-containing protein [Thermococcus sp. MV11]
MTSSTDVVLDTSVIVKGILPPLRRKRDDVYHRQLSLHLKAKELLKKAQNGELTLHEPVIALVETSTVLWRLSKSERIVDIGIRFLETYSVFYSDVYLLEDAMEIGRKTGASGFDVLFLACAKRRGAKLITDDRKMYEKALESGIEAELLRETPSSP